MYYTVSKVRKIGIYQKAKSANYNFVKTLKSHAELYFGLKEDRLSVSLVCPKRLRLNVNSNFIGCVYQFAVIFSKIFVIF